MFLSEREMLPYARCRYIAKNLCLFKPTHMVYKKLSISHSNTNSLELFDDSMQDLFAGNFVNQLSD